MDIMIYMRETNVTGSDMLPRLNYYKKNFAAGAPQFTPDPIGSLIIAEWTSLIHITASRKGTAAVSKPLNPGWLHLWIIIPHEVMLTLHFKCNTADNFAENFATGASPRVVFRRRAQNLKLCHWIQDAIHAFKS